MLEKRKLNNPGLKIASLVAAILIWIVISNINDPIMTKTIKGVPVRVMNASYLESMGQSYKIREGYNTVTVKVKGKRSMVDELSLSDIEATADMTEIVSLESSPITVPIRVAVGDGSGLVITATPSTIQIDLEELISQDFLITATQNKTTPEVGYAVGQLTPSIEKVAVTGPASIINIIDRVEAPVDVSHMNAGRKISTGLVVYDKNGAQLTETQMSYLRFEDDQKTVDVYVTIYRVVSDVRLTLAGYNGRPADGYQVAQITLTPSTIAVAGNEEALEKLARNRSEITLDRSLVDIANASASFDVRIENLGEYLPEGLILVTNASDTVVASVEILPYNSKLIKAATAGIEKKYLAEGLNCVFSSAAVQVAVQGPDAGLSKLTASEIGLAVDLSNKGPGTYTVPLEVTLPDEFRTVEDVTVTVVLTATETASNTTDSGNKIDIE